MCTQSTAPIAIVAIVIRGNWQQRKQTPLKPIVAHFYNCTQRNRNFYLKSFRCFRERNGIKISSKMKTEKQLKSLRNGLKKTAMANCIRCVFAWRKRKYSHTRDCGDDYAHFIVPAQKTARNCCCRFFFFFLSHSHCGFCCFAVAGVHRFELGEFSHAISMMHISLSLSVYPPFVYS